MRLFIYEAEQNQTPEENAFTKDLNKRLNNNKGIKR
jgi:hypothetical protein